MAEPVFCNHVIVTKSPDDYVELTCAPATILRAWASSLYAHELITPEGTIKDAGQIAPDSLKKFLDAVEALKRGEETPKPVLGIGIFDGIEIGIGREVVAAAGHLNLPSIPVNVRVAQEREIRGLLGL